MNRINQFHAPIMPYNYSTSSSSSSSMASSMSASSASSSIDSLSHLQSLVAQHSMSVRYDDEFIESSSIASQSSTSVASTSSSSSSSSQTASLYRQTNNRARTVSVPIAQTNAADNEVAARPAQRVRSMPLLSTLSSSTSSSLSSPTAEISPNARSSPINIPSSTTEIRTQPINIHRRDREAPYASRRTNYHSESFQNKKEQLFGFSSEHDVDDGDVSPYEEYSDDETETMMKMKMPDYSGAMRRASTSSQVSTASETSSTSSFSRSSRTISSLALSAASSSSTPFDLPFLCDEDVNEYSSSTLTTMMTYVDMNENYRAAYEDLVGGFGSSMKMTTNEEVSCPAVKTTGFNVFQF